MLTDADGLVRVVSLRHGLWEKLESIFDVGFLDRTDFFQTVWHPVADHPNAIKWLERCIMYADFSWQMEKRGSANDNDSPMIGFSAQMVL
jgi:hypothetical protein